MKIHYYKQYNQIKPILSCESKGPQIDERYVNLVIVNKKENSTYPQNSNSTQAVNTHKTTRDQLLHTYEMIYASKEHIQPDKIFDNCVHINYCWVEQELGKLRFVII